MTITKQSTKSLFDLWQDSRRLLCGVTVYQARETLLRQEARGLTKPVEAIAIPVPGGSANDPRIIELEKALQAALPLFKDALDSDLFEEWLIGDDPSDTSDVPF